MQKYFINNRHGLKIAIVADRPWFSRGTVLVMHGLDSHKDAKQVSLCAKIFRSYRYTSVRFDATNSIGESGGDIKQASISTYFDDLEDVLAWMHVQPWFRRPLILAGHSLGGLCTSLYAERNPDNVAALLPMAPAVSGAFLLDAVEKRYPEEVKRWRDTGEIVLGEHVPLHIRICFPESVDDFMRYDLLPQAPAISMPSLFIVGENDWLTPPNSTKILYENVSGKKEIHVIPGAPHTLREKEHLNKAEEIMSAWVKNL